MEMKMMGLASREIKAHYMAHYIIKVSLIGIIGDDIVDISNPESTPIYSLNFIKNRFGGEWLGEFLFDGEKVIEQDLQPTREIMQAIVAATNEFIKSGTDVIYLNEHGVIK